MQPKDFDEDVANSAERGVKRRRRAELMAERWKKALPNSPSLRRFFVEETQPRSPVSWKGQVLFLHTPWQETFIFINNNHPFKIIQWHLNV